MDSEKQTTVDEDFYEDFHSVPSIENTSKKKTLPVIPILSALAVLILIIVLVISFTHNDKRIIKKAFAAYEKTDGEAYADLLEEEQIKSDMEFSGKDAEDDDEVSAFYKDYIQESNLLSDSHFTYDIIDTNELPSKFVKEYNEDSIYELENLTAYTIKITYDDFDKYAFQYCSVLIGKDKKMGKVFLGITEFTPLH